LASELKDAEQPWVMLRIIWQQVGSESDQRLAWLSHMPASSLPVRDVSLFEALHIAPLLKPRTHPKLPNVPCLVWVEVDITHYFHSNPSVSSHTSTGQLGS
jgi:hypothetical protein